MKLHLLLALHGAHASHKVTKNAAVDAETTQRLAVEAATASVVKMPGAVAKLFGRAEGAEDCLTLCSHTCIAQSVTHKTLADGCCEYDGIEL